MKAELEGHLDLKVAMEMAMSKANKSPILRFVAGCPQEELDRFISVIQMFGSNLKDSNPDKFRSLKSVFAKGMVDSPVESRAAPSISNQDFATELAELFMANQETNDRFKVVEDDLNVLTRDFVELRIKVDGHGEQRVDHGEQLVDHEQRLLRYLIEKRKKAAMPMRKSS